MVKQRQATEELNTKIRPWKQGERQHKEGQVSEFLLWESSAAVYS